MPDTKLLERIYILEDDTEMARIAINVHTDQIRTLQHTVGFMQGLIEELDNELEKLRKSIT